MTHTSFKYTLLLRNAIILLIVPFHVKTATAGKYHPASHIHRGLEEDILQCTVYESGALTLTKDEEAESAGGLSCAAEDRYGPTVFLEGNRDIFFSNKLVSGLTSLTIPTHLVSAHLQVDLDDPRASEMITISYGDRQRRGLYGYDQKESYLAEFEGTFGILVVRVSDNRNHAPTYSADEISKHVFTDDLTITSQYRACSNDKLRLVPADGSDVVNGVLDVVVDVDLSRLYTSQACVVAADNIINSSSYDLGTHQYVMYICPDVVDFLAEALGLADFNGPKSWYRDIYGSMPFVQMHQFGHNLGFYHSELGFGDYVGNDPTGVMGSKYEIGTDWGKMCFNAAKTYTTGWYSEHHEGVSPHLAPYNGNIVDINSASSGLVRGGDDVVVRVQTPTNVNYLYFMLHRLEGITSDMVVRYREEHANRVNIVSQVYPRGFSSQLVASLASGEEYIENDWADTGKALHIKACSIADDSTLGGAHVIAYLEGEKSTNCNEKPKNAPSSIPSLSPSIAPTSPSPTCTDSTLKMFIRDGARKSCSWVANNNTEERCMIPGVALHCPVTCDACIICIDSWKRFQMRNVAKDIKSCSWVRKTNTATRCKKEGVASTCRATCKTCNA